MYAVVTAPSCPSSIMYLVSTGWQRWRSASRWPEWQEGRSLFPSSSSAEGYCPPAPAERETERRRKDMVRKSLRKTRTICGIRDKRRHVRRLKEGTRRRITGKINGWGCQSRTNVSQSRCLSPLKETCQQQQEEDGGWGGGGILNEPSISGYHPQTNVTDKNGSHATPLNCTLDNSLARAQRSLEVGKTG